MERGKQGSTTPEYIPVKIRGKEVLFPNQCPCCGATADQRITMEKEKVIPLGVVRIKRSIKLEVPSCGKCAPYFRWNQSGGYLRLIGMLIPVFVLCLFLWIIPGLLLSVVTELIFKSPMPRWLSGILLFGSAAAGTGYWVNRQIRKKPAEKLPAHLCCDFMPVGVKHFDADTITMGFLARDYAESFRRFNEANLVASTIVQPAAANTARTGLQFTYYDASGSVQACKVYKQDFLVGSRADCDFRIESLAPEECRIYISPQGYYVLDLSGNVSINGNHGSGYLQDNDVLEIGPVSVRVSVLS